MDDHLEHNVSYLESLRDAVVKFDEQFKAFLDLHDITTSATFGPRGIIPAVRPKDSVSPDEIERLSTLLSRAAGTASVAISLTNTYVMVQNVGQVDPITNWDVITKPKPVLEPADILTAASSTVGRLDALILKARFKNSAGEAHAPVAPKSITPASPTSIMPRVFIGSSTEGLEAAKSLQVLLQYACESEVWSQGLFGPGPSTLETLVKAAPNYDFAILVVNPDDTTTSRDVTHNAVRDNVIFELGLFIGALGREHVFMVHDRDNPPQLPSDLAGVTPATYANSSTGNWDAALGPAATVIERAIKHGADGRRTT